MILTGYILFSALLWVCMSGYLLLKSRAVSYLKEVALPPGLPEPTVAIIIAVKDEEAEVEAALTSVCLLDYSNANIIVINDRSTDGTAEILHKMAQENPALSLITIEELPAGWLGKNHALYQGYHASTAEWMLFTDADVLFNKEALKKAMAYVATNQLDHLTVLPEITSPSTLFKSVMNTFALMLEMKLRPWDVPNPASKASIGVGAFNLVKRTAYEKAGTHACFSMRPDDDLKLGERIKATGCRQDVVYGEKEISLAWYTSLHEFVKGLMKNTFSVSNYRLSGAISMALSTLVVFVLPLPVALLAGNFGLALAGIMFASQIILFLFKKGIHGKWWHALLIPFAGAVMVYIVLKSAFKTIRQGGIYWRDSFYSLEELKKQC